MNDFGNRLKAIREERGMTLEELAQQLQTTKQVLSRYENGQRVPKVSAAARIAKALGVPLARLIPDAGGASSDDTWEARDDLRNDPNRRALLSLAQHGSAEDVRQVAAIIDALRATNPDFYDGDDPA